METVLYIFLFEEYGDLDRLTPIVWKMVQRGHVNVEVYCYNPTFDLEGDFRVDFLRRSVGVRVDYIHYAISRSSLRRLVHTMGKARNTWTERIIARLAYHGLRPLGISPKNLLTRTCYAWRIWLNNCAMSLSFFREFFREKKPDVIYMKNINRPPAIAAAADEAGIPIVAGPHGMDISAELDCTHSKTAPERVRQWFDYQIVQSDIERQRQLRCYEASSDKILVIGSPRYCREWHDTYLGLVPRQIIPTRAGAKLNVAYMCHSPKLVTEQDNIVCGMTWLHEHPQIELILRAGGGGSMGLVSAFGVVTHLSPKAQEIKGIFIDHDTHSANLIRWADVVISTISSIGMEVFLQNKLFIYPKHFHRNRMGFEKYGACLSIQSFEEFVEAFERLLLDGVKIPYPSENVGLFFSEYVYGGRSDRDVLGGYCDIIEQAAREKRNT